MSTTCCVSSISATTSVPSESEASASNEAQAPGLPQPAAVWTDATTALLAALAEFFQKTREGMREVKKAFDASRFEQMQSEVESMRNQADQIRSGALMQAATLGLSAGLGAGSLVTANKTSAWLGWASQTAGKLQDPVKSIYDAQAKDCEADGASARASAERAKTNGEDMGDMAGRQGELASKAMDAIRAVLEARHASAMAILSQRG